jgi:NADPH-dependent 2,4-dienoyl-CoA reductase/sulfur reductase-like enzyme
VVIAGGGAAGMEAARVAALRGHAVTLLEKDGRLGGAMNPYAVIMGDSKENVGAITTYFQAQLNKLGVDVRLNTEVNRAVIAPLTPEVIIIASGGRHSMPDVPGVDKSHVVASRQFHEGLKRWLEESGGRAMAGLDRRYVPVGESVAVIGDYQGTQTAEFLIKRGCRVSIVESGPQIGKNLLHHLVRPQVYDWLYRLKVPMFTSASLQVITDKGVGIITADGQERFLAVDTVLFSLPFESDDELYNSLAGVAPEVYCIGDCRRPGKIVDAVADGARIGREI